MERESESLPRRGATLTGNEPPEAIGAYLSRQRRLRGISLEALHKTTQIPLRSLERLEAGAFDKKPDGFVRGLVRTVAEALGLDPSETVTRMLREVVAPDATTHLGSFSKQHILVLGTLALILVTGLALWVAVSWDEEAAPPAAALPQRRDAVRELLRQVESKAWVPPRPVVDPSLNPVVEAVPDAAASAAPTDAQAVQTPSAQRSTSGAVAPSDTNP